MRVDLSSTDFDYLDPALSYASWTWQFTYLTNYKLLNFPDKSAPEGGKLIPEGADVASADLEGRQDVHVHDQGRSKVQQR